jgi:tRNA(fMet)-specific endonuclease VapC
LEVNIALDTNTYTAFMAGRGGTVDLVRRSDRVWMPVPVLAELRFGFARGTKGRANAAILTRFLDSKRVGVLPCDDQTASTYAQLKAELTERGTPIPINHVWIAALAIQHAVLLHTLDSDFERIPQLARV